MAMAARGGQAVDAGAWSGSSGLEGLGKGSRVWFPRGTPQLGGGAAVSESVKQWSGGTVQEVGRDAWRIRADEGDDVVVPTIKIQPANPAVMEVRRGRREKNGRG